MLVETAEVSSGKAEPMAEFVGTAYYARTAQVAAEVSGLVRAVMVDDGEKVSKGTRLVTLDDDILNSEIEGAQADFEQNRVDLEKAKKDFERISNLYKEDAIAETEYESYQTTQSRYEKQHISLKARLDKLLLEQKKKTIRAPFDGLVIETLVEPGEWVSVGGTVAQVADNRTFEVLVDIPANLTSHLKSGRSVSATISNQTVEATFLTIIPKGDIATRTFTAKFGLEQNPSFIEGMQASVMLPTATSIDGLLVPRDAVINQFGQNVLFLAVEGAAKMVPVQVIGYQGMQVAVTGDGLEAGQQVVIKGNERIRDGQPVRF
jgi:RND family efflux transporter MFP subunit